MAAGSPHLFFPGISDVDGCLLIGIPQLSCFVGVFSQVGFDHRLICIHVFSVFLASSPHVFMVSSAQVRSPVLLLQLPMSSSSSVPFYLTHTGLITLLVKHIVRLASKVFLV